MRRMSGIAIAVLLLGTAAPPATAQTAKPTARVNTAFVKLGDKVLVQGDGWPARTLVLLQLCGNGGVESSADCDLLNAINAGVGPTGTFSM